MNAWRHGERSAASREARRQVRELLALARLEEAIAARNLTV